MILTDILKLHEIKFANEKIPWAKAWEKKLKRAVKYLLIYWNAKSPELLSYLAKFVPNWKEKLEKLEIIPVRYMKLQFKIENKNIRKLYEPDVFFHDEIGKLFIKINEVDEVKIAHEISKMFKGKRREIELSLVAFMHYDSEEEVINALKNLGISLT